MSASWREKYLTVLDEQESQERRFQHQIKQLRACIDQLALAADGIDPSLDDLLTPLKKKKPNARIDVEDLFKSAKQVIARRDTRLSVSTEALNQLVDSLQNLNPSRSFKASLSKYQSDIHKRIGKLHAYPQLLHELSELHSQVLDNVIHKRPNWMARRFGAPVVFKNDDQGQQSAPDKKSDEEASVSELPSEESSNLDGRDTDNEIIEEDTQKPKESLDEPSYIEGEFHVVSTESGEEVVDNLLQDDGEGVIKSVQQNDTSQHSTNATLETENKFTKIEEKIAVILTEMLASVEVADCVREKFEQSKQRISDGLNWYEMVATLEDIRDLFQQAMYEANSEFETYLATVDIALADVKRLIPNQLTQKRNQKSLTSDIKQRLEQQSSTLVERINQTADLDSLKQSVATHVSELSQQLKDLDALSGSMVEDLENTELLQRKIQELEDNQRVLQKALSEQRYRALHDVLTGLPNRDFYNQWIYEKYAAWRDASVGLVICICDVDNFKAFNDTYGHQAGDRVLKLIGKLLASVKKQENFVGRFGGEEFVIAMSAQAKNQCEALVEKVRVKLASTSFRFQEKPVTITASFGLTEFKSGDSIETALKRADDALYKAKADGRNQLCST